MPTPLLLVFLAGCAVGWVHDRLGRRAGTAILLAWFLLLAAQGFTDVSSSTWAVRFLEGFVGAHAGIAVRGLVRHFRRRRVRTDEA